MTKRIALSFLIVLTAVGLSGCPAQPAESVAFSKADFAKSVETALISLEKVPPTERREAKEPLEELIERHATPEQKDRYSRLLAER